MLPCIHAQGHWIVSVYVVEVMPIRQPGGPLDEDLPSSSGRSILPVLTNRCQPEEVAFVLVLLTPLQHPVVCHHLLKAFISDSAFELDERFHLVCGSLLGELCVLNVGPGLFSGFIG